MESIRPSTSVSNLHNLIRKTTREGTKPKVVIKSGPLQFLNVCNCANSYDEVHPGIFIGDHSYSRDVFKLRSLGVTHILNAAQGQKFAQIDSQAENFVGDGYTIQFLGLKAQDISGYQLSQHFQEATDFIHNALTSGGKVFVHCYQGISRSAALVLAYLMMYQKLSLEDAIVTVRKKREIFPNSGFLKQLLELEDQLQKKRQQQKDDKVSDS